MNSSGAVFADTFYWVALINPRDSAHTQAVTLAKSLSAATIITTEEVLIETLNYFSAYRPEVKVSAIKC